ncbi:MAG TPA: hypothetical protein VM053_05790 [Gemmatimonadaceae bacterium]|nr:hypothetical protein [Gemmatimonadaceae bacterium]
MRKIVSIAAIAGVLVAAACSSKDAVMSDELKKDLDAASTSNSIDLATPKTPANQVVSAIERTTPPAPRKIASSQRVVRHTAAPRGVRAPVEVQAADVSEEVEAQPTEVAPAPIDPAPLPSPRPQPVSSTIGGGDREGRMGGSGGGGIGNVIGGIFTVVVRGGGVDGDHCDPRTDGRRPTNTAINNRLPVIGTFPGSGRIGGAGMPIGTYPSSGGGVGRGRGRF